MLSYNIDLKIYNKKFVIPIKMGNFADRELLWCDEKLDINFNNDDMMDIECNSLKPQHLMFDGLDKEYFFSECNQDLFKKKENEYNIDYINDWMDDSNEDSDNNDNWTINDFITIRNWQTHNGLNSDKVSYTIDEYLNNRQYDIMNMESCPPYYEQFDHTWSLPERDEMEDLQEKIESLDISDHFRPYDFNEN